MAENAKPAQLRDSRRAAIAWLAGQLAWETTLDGLRDHDSDTSAADGATTEKVAA